MKAACIPFTMLGCFSGASDAKGKQKTTSIFFLIGLSIHSTLALEFVSNVLGACMLDESENSYISRYGSVSVGSTTILAFFLVST